MCNFYAAAFYTKVMLKDLAELGIEQDGGKLLCVLSSSANTISLPSFPRVCPSGSPQDCRRSVPAIFS
jgi:hypothetical protein